MKHLIFSLMVMIPMIALADKAPADLSSFTVVDTIAATERANSLTEIAYDSKSVKTDGVEKTVRVLITYVANKHALYGTIRLNCADNNESFVVVEAYRVDRSQPDPELVPQPFSVDQPIHDARLVSLFAKVCSK